MVGSLVWSRTQRCLILIWFIDAAIEEIDHSVLRSDASPAPVVRPICTHACTPWAWRDSTVELREARVAGVRQHVRQWFGVEGLGDGGVKISAYMSDRIVWN